MLKEKIIYLPIGTLTAVTMICGAILSSGAASATGTTVSCTTSNGIITCSNATTGGSPQISTENIAIPATVTVSSACTLTGTPYEGSFEVSNDSLTTTTSLSNSEKPLMTASCNDPDGFYIKAVGDSDPVTVSSVTYTNYMVGTTGLNIPTGNNISGDSAWAFKVTSATATSANTTAAIANGYGTFTSIPNSETTVVTVTGSTSGTMTANIRTDYQVYISTYQGAGTYTGKVKYSLVRI